MPKVDVDKALQETAEQCRGSKTDIVVAAAAGGEDSEHASPPTTGASSGREGGLRDGSVVPELVAAYDQGAHSMNGHGHGAYEDGGSGSGVRCIVGLGSD